MAKVAGSIWVEGNDLHYVDYFNREWSTPGVFVKSISPGPKPGSLWQDSGTTAGIYWVNEAGNGIYRTPITHVRLIPVGPPITSLWVEQSNNYLTWLWYYDGTRNQILNNHWDVATVNTHGDSHVDGAHIDTPHTDVAHVDVPSSSNHIDYHNDVPHGDFWDSGHGDTAGVNFADHSDHWYVGGQPGAHYDGHTFHQVSHGDSWTSPYGGSPPNPYGQQHLDTIHDDTMFNQAPPPQHWDGPTYHNIPHDDWHSDSPHQDAPPWIHHGDYWDVAGHQDSPHSDVIHNDAAHQDTHDDSHGDTPHTDQPILIGP